MDDDEKTQRPSQYACTLDDVAVALGVSRQGARVIERRALEKSAAILRERGVDADFREVLRSL